MKTKAKIPSSHKPGFWSEAPCYGCKSPLNTPDETQRLCPNCHEAMLEGLASRLDPNYDRSRLNEGPDCWSVLFRLYTRWDWTEPGFLVAAPR